MDGELLEKIYQENLEERVIACFAEKEKLTLQDAMSLYYSSNLSRMIHRGDEGIQYLDPKVLADILPDMFHTNRI